MVAKHVQPYHIAMSDVLSESTVDCHTLQDVACSDHCAIAVAFNFDQLPMTHTIERPKNKHINWKFEDVVLKRQFHERLDNMLDAAPGGLLRVNRGSDVNRLTDLLTFISNAILRASSKYLGCGNPQNSGESNIANLWKVHISAIAISVGSTDNRDQVMNALRTVPGHNDVNKYMS